MGGFFSKAKKQQQTALPVQTAPKQLPQLNQDVIGVILAFCHDEILRKTDQIPELSDTTYYVLQQRIRQELALFGVDAKHLNLHNLSFQQLYTLRQYLWMMENHKAIHSRVVQLKAEEIKILLEAVIEPEAPGVAKYLYSIFSALAAYKVPVLEQLPEYLALLTQKSAKLKDRLLAIYYYSKNSPEGVPLFEALAQKGDKVSDWYLYQIYRQGLCGQEINLEKAMTHFNSSAAECVRSVEFIVAYKNSLSRLYSLTETSGRSLSKVDQAVLNLAQQLSPDEQEQLARMVTIHQIRITV